MIQLYSSPSQNLVVGETSSGENVPFTARSARKLARLEDTAWRLKQVITLAANRVAALGYQLDDAVELILAKRTLDDIVDFVWRMKHFVLLKNNISFYKWK